MTPRALKAAAAAGLAGMIALAVPALARTVDWQIEEPSAVRFQFTQLGARVMGAFDAYQAQVEFHPDNPQSCSVVFTIDLSSANTNSAERDGILKSAEFFDVERFPQASFRSTACGQRYLNAFEASGDLTIRDVTQQIRLPFTLDLQQQAGRPFAVAKGELSINRLDFGIGTGQWSSDLVVGHTVRIQVELYATGEN